MPKNPPQPGSLLSIPSLPFVQALELQHTLAAQRSENQQPDTLILTEHEPVLTLGRTTKPEHWEAHWAELQEKGIALQQTNRGGSVTYHGPGQIIGYPILRLRNFCPGPRIYVQKLEEVLIRTLAEWGIVGCRHESFRGVWVDSEEGHAEKIASIGVRISKGITMHGFALNVNVNLQPFSLLTPCGIDHCVMTSMKKLLNQQVNVAQVREQVAAYFADVFQLEWTEVEP
ncbi:MAG: lipoyl(octanoyl) transferase LipB [Nitrospirota bacterium]|nr:lipoyl(octanoyl) transferase LipB [Nitrospirota bacterium]